MNKPHRILFTQIPLAQLAVTFAAGIAVSNKFHLSLVFLFTASVIFSLLSLLALVFRYYRVSAVILMLAFLTVGASANLLDKGSGTNHLKQLLDQEEIGEREAVKLTGVLIAPPSFARDRLYLNLSVEEIIVDDTQHSTSGVVNLLAVFRNHEQEQSFRNLDLRYGDRLQVSVALRRNDQYRNPGVSTLSEFLEQKGWDAVGLLKSPNAIARRSVASRFSLLGTLYDWRERLQRRIDGLFNAETAGVLDAAIIGNRNNLTSDVTERFRAGGTFHVLVISGFHISFLGGIVYLCARRLMRSRRSQFLLSNAVVWSYSLAVGAEASVVRASLMFTFVTFATVLFRSSSSLNALGGAALLILLYRPRDLFDPSFQLTFLSVLAIVALASPIIKKLTAIGKWYPTRRDPYPPACSSWVRFLAETLFWSQRNWEAELKRSSHNYRLWKAPAAIWLDRFRLQATLRYIFCAVVISLSVQLMLLPLMVVYFHRVSLSSVVLNIGVSVLLAGLTLFAAIAMVLQPLSASLAAPFVLVANAINSLMVSSVVPFTRLGVDSIRIPEYIGTLKTTYGLYYVPLFLILILLFRWQPLARPRLGRSKHKFAYVAVTLQLVMVLTVLFHPWSARPADGRLHVEFLDVGQGDSALVTMPDGTTLLVDGGGRPNFFQSNNGGGPMREQRSIGETVVSEFLWSLGLDHVDYVVATHADADHIDGLNDVLRNFAVRAAIVARTPASDPEFAHFAETLKTTKVPLTIVGGGDILSFGPASAEVLAPTVNGESSGNNDSLVLRLRFGERSILLTGDIEKSAEAGLVGSGRELKADVVKVAHHGSRTSSTEAFVTATHASVVIVSVGLTSMFGHPHKEVVERWRTHGAQVLTTGKCGTISVSTDGTDLSVTRYRPC